MEIDNVLDSLIDTIKESKIYLNYNHILEQVRVNEDINKTTAEIKKLQQDLVKEEFKKGSRIKELEALLNDKKKFLYSIPLYNDYIEGSKELENLLGTVSSKLQSYLNGLEI